jgi:hypothetical protein
MQSERYVQVADMSPENMPQAFQGAGPMDVPRPLTFDPVEMRYFRAEHTLSDQDIVIHFYVSSAVRKNWSESQIAPWWLNDFANSMSNEAQKYFNAGPPRLMAKYTPEVASWWFKAQGFAHMLDVGAFLRAFYEQLDETLHSELVHANGPLVGKV